jgi:hypothetical protein
LITATGPSHRDAAARAVPLATLSENSFWRSASTRS